MVEALVARPEVNGRVGVVGFSLGAAKAMLLAARQPAIKAAIGYYGVYDLRLLMQHRMREKANFPVMPVDVAADVAAPVLLLHGEWDDETPLDQAEAMRDALRKAGKTVELVVYPKSYHRFDRGPAPRMRGDRSAGGYTYRLNDSARQDAWNRTLAWCRKYLVGP